MKNKIALYSSCISFLTFAQIAYADNAQHDWSGGYIGGSLGALHGKSSYDASTKDSFPGSYFTNPDAAQIGDEANKSSSQSRLSAGIFGGYGQQYDKLYIGVEAGINSLSVDDSSTSGDAYTSLPSARFTNKISIKADWQATLRARLGWTNKRWLTYVSGGIAASKIRVAGAYSDDSANSAYGYNSEQETKLGWTLGVGSEYALSDNWTIRGEYLYTDYGDVDTKSTVRNSGFPNLSNELKSAVELKTHIVSVGISYRF
nr:outer membrane beta-barrel protein [uncultured Methylophaga sp.]